MTQPIRLQSLVASPAAGFEEPFGMLEACHERVQRMLALLQRLREHLASHGADTQAQQAARDVMRYFDQAAPLHHQDEELHVFPPLLARGSAQAVQVVRRLQEDHV
ncbi:MAG TPA: hemerythrin domain-containing protein, partial [Ramlibacter sp.]|nr:hemerythrin domain-containing protein [Ramlibacter sp.]